MSGNIGENVKDMRKSRKSGNIGENRGKSAKLTKTEKSWKFLFVSDLGFFCFISEKRINGTDRKKSEQF